MLIVKNNMLMMLMKNNNHVDGAYYVLMLMVNVLMSLIVCNCVPNDDDTLPDTICSNMEVLY